MAVLLETTMGDLVVDLFVKERPNCSKNFLKLCKMKYYNMCSIHHLEPNFIAQTGDPTGTGRGGESIFSFWYGDQARYFEKEDVPKMRHLRTGLISFVNNGNGMLGSQFFFTLAENLDYLDDMHTIFGQVTEGIETLEKFNQQICGDDHKPFRDIRIAHTIILDDPFPDPPQMEPPSRSPSPTFERLLCASQVAIDEDDQEEAEGLTEEELQRIREDNEMYAQAQILEIVGDIRSAEDVPPENVLFVCKLNPVTTDEDLEIIFSRFGKVNCCEIIRDRRTGASLQYAFIEYANPKSVEAAYHKMDNVLIDDRRIHVDFSQSVAKNYKWRKGQGGRADVLTDRNRSRGKEKDADRKHVSRRDDKRRSRSPVRRRRSRSPERRRVDERDTRKDRDRNSRRHESARESERREVKREHRSPDRRRNRRASTSLAKSSQKRSTQSVDVSRSASSSSSPSQTSRSPIRVKKERQSRSASAQEKRRSRYSPGRVKRELESSDDEKAPKKAKKSKKERRRNDSSGSR